MLQDLLDELEKFEPSYPEDEEYPDENEEYPDEEYLELEEFKNTL